MCVSQIEVKRLETENGELKSELGIEKEKLHTLEAAFEQMRKAGASLVPMCCVMMTSVPCCTVVAFRDREGVGAERK